MLLGLASAVAQADTEAKELPLIPAALDKVGYVTEARPKLDAKVYFLFKSHSKCGYCVSHTPSLVKLHKAMRGKGAELVMLNADRNIADAEKWAESSKMTYALVKPADSAKVPFEFDVLKMRTPMPLMLAVTAHGEVLGMSGGPEADSIVKDWRKHVAQARKLERERKAAEKKDAAESDDDEADDDDEKSEKKSKKDKKKKKKKKSKRRSRD